MDIQWRVGRKGPASSNLRPNLIFICVLNTELLRQALSLCVNARRIERIRPTAIGLRHMRHLTRLPAVNSPRACQQESSGSVTRGEVQRSPCSLDDCREHLQRRLCSLLCTSLCGRVNCEAILAFRKFETAHVAFEQSQSRVRHKMRTLTREAFRIARKNRCPARRALSSDSHGRNSLPASIRRTRFPPVIKIRCPRIASQRGAVRWAIVVKSPSSLFIFESISICRSNRAFGPAP